MGVLGALDPYVHRQNLDKAEGVSVAQRRSGEKSGRRDSTMGRRRRRKNSSQSSKGDHNNKQNKEAQLKKEEQEKQDREEDANNEDEWDLLGSNGELQQKANAEIEAVLQDVTGPSHELYYPTVAISALVRVLRDPTLGMHHSLVGKYSKRRRSKVAVIIVRIVSIRSFFFYCLLLNHSFPTNPNKITNCFQLILSLLQLYKLHLLNAFVYFDF